MSLQAKLHQVSFNQIPEGDRIILAHKLAYLSVYLQTLTKRIMDTQQEVKLKDVELVLISLSDALDELLNYDTE